MVASAAAAVTTIVTAYGLLSAVTPERVAVATATATIPTPIDQLFDALAVDREQAFRAVVFSPLVEHDYGGRGFSVTDPEGNILSFGSYGGEPT